MPSYYLCNWKLYDGGEGAALRSAIAERWPGFYIDLDVRADGGAPGRTVSVIFEDLTPQQQSTIVRDPDIQLLADRLLDVPQALRARTLANHDRGRSEAFLSAVGASPDFQRMVAQKRQDG